MNYIPFRFTRPKQLELVAKPKLSVAVVIACRDGQEKLNLVLASLAQQTYPSSLTRVYIIDDGSEKALVLPTLKPKNTKIIKYSNVGEYWGKTVATNDVVEKLKEDVLWFLDADMVVEPDHLSHHMKWHHDNSDYVVLGWKRFVQEWNYTPKELATALSKGRFHQLHQESWGKDLWESRIERTQELSNPGYDGYRSLVGATFSMMRSNWDALGGYDRNLRTGEDTELGWRVFNSGLRMLPERDAHSWHLGYSTIETNKELLHKHNDPSLAQLIPQFHAVRARYPYRYLVPTYDVIVDVRDTTLVQLQGLKANLLSLQGTQARFTLLGPWHQLLERYSPVEDANANLREILNWLSEEPDYSFVAIDSDEELAIDNLVESFTHSSTHYYLFIEGSFDLNLKDLVDHLHATNNGFVGVASKEDKRAFAIYGPALARAQRMGGWIYSNISSAWGVEWVTEEKFLQLYQGKHNRIGKFITFLKREGKKVNSLPQLLIFVKKIAKLVIKKATGRG